MVQIQASYYIVVTNTAIVTIWKGDLITEKCSCNVGQNEHAYIYHGISVSMKSLTKEVGCYTNIYCSFIQEINLRENSQPPITEGRYFYHFPDKRAVNIGFAYDWKYSWHHYHSSKNLKQNLPFALQTYFIAVICL